MIELLLIGSAMGLMAGKLMAKPKPAPRPFVGAAAAPDPFLSTCPVDPHMPEEFRRETRNAWVKGNVEELMRLAPGVKSQGFPIAAHSLIARAWELSRAQVAQQREATVTPITSAPTKNGAPSNPAIKKEEKPLEATT